MPQACNIFESKQKFARTDPRLQARLRSPFSSQSPQKSYIHPVSSNSDSDSDDHREVLADIFRPQPAATPLGSFDLFKNAKNKSPAASSTQSKTASNTSTSKKTIALQTPQRDRHSSAANLDDISASSFSTGHNYEVLDDDNISLSTVKNDSDAENKPADWETKPVTDNTSTRPFARSSKHAASAIKAHPDPHTPSPQTGSCHLKERREKPSSYEEESQLSLVKSEELLLAIMFSAGPSVQSQL